MTIHAHASSVSGAWSCRGSVFVFMGHLCRVCLRNPDRFTGFQLSRTHEAPLTIQSVHICSSTCMSNATMSALIIYASLPRLHTHRTTCRHCDHRHPLVSRACVPQRCPQKGPRFAAHLRFEADAARARAVLRLERRRIPGRALVARDDLHFGRAHRSADRQRLRVRHLTSAAAACAVASGVCSNYVLGATLENSSNAALSNDIDGTVGSVACADAVYCVQP
jgi:hypothetical protein